EIDDLYVDNALSILAGTINNTVIGGITAAAGSFTTLGASGALTVTGNADMKGTLDVAGAVDFDNSLFVSLNMNVSGNTSITGATTLQDLLTGTSAEFSGTVTASIFQGDGSQLSGIPSGSGGATRIAYWSDADTITGDQEFVWITGTDTLFVTGSVKVTGTVTANTVDITGGSDLAEAFDISFDGEIEPGMLVCIDGDSVGKLNVTTSAYDRMIAGVISGANGINPGLVMGQEGTVADGKYPVALVGRVYVKCVTYGAAIKPGDLLTSSKVPGHAMRVTNYKKARGAIIGKAMSGLNEKTGMVLVLVNAPH
ncbi:MAG: hypothetical protein HRT90_04810, partial [Candidatus Margulisbacteria bacterium]|nr:hypothetical protein [Candidatus Margulisiibacteriota bacterium]